ncbi:polysaccharide pyruvyl transferase family protein [Bradyrhizobium sp. LLZ17]|uniref:Polysaccharide pyruvyl transferase family protein n=1 Tax=Bradyrhizobium sp. LLZ17 TaxID=3239388 RepID=A0AB39XVA2_9BRAD
MDSVAVVDTSICTDNLGDEIIMDAVNDVVSELFPKAYVYRVPSHEQLSDRTRRFISDASFCVIGGTNLLSSDIQPYGLWRVRQTDADVFGATNTVCLGTGWNDYMSTATPATRAILRAALSRQLIHSARDSYTVDHLTAIGAKAVNTSCPTTWSLTPEHCAGIQKSKAPSVIFTLSAWRRDVEADRAFVATLRKFYSKLYFFPQMHDDYEYFRSFGWDDEIPATTVKEYSRFLESENVDFIGTRLHGGIRALQKKRRALIISIDNRAAEIGKDTGLPVAPRGDLKGIETWIEDQMPTVLHLPQRAIDDWKAQFVEIVRSGKRLPTNISRDELTAGRLATVKKYVRAGLRLAVR